MENKSGVMPKILSRKISQCNIQMPLSIDKSFTITAETKSKLRESKDMNDIIMLDVFFECSSPDYNDFVINLNAHFIFENVGLLVDIERAAAKFYVPAAHSQLYDDIDNILNALGHPALNLAEQEKHNKQE